MPAIQGVILDTDGTLVDSNEAHARAWVEALAEHGHQVDLEAVRRLIGMGGDKLMPKVSGVAEESDQGHAISARRKDIFQTMYLPQLQALPGARALVQHLHDIGMPVVVASSAKRDELQQLLEIAEVTDLIQDMTSSDDAENSKPDPDIVQVALDVLGLPPDAVVMIGDTPYDIEAAGKAGIKTIAFRSGGWDDSELKGALAVYDHPADLLAHFDLSPLQARSLREV